MKSLSRLFLAGCFLLSSNMSFASNMQLCSLKPEALVKTIKLPPTRGGERGIFYFFKPIPGTPYVSFIANDEKQNYLFNMDTGEMKEIPGHTDPIPTPDGRFMTTSEITMNLWRVSDLVSAAPNKSKSAPHAYEDMTVHDSYQSYGIVGREGNKTHYRVITGRNDRLQFKDFWVSDDGKFEAPGRPTPLCSYLPLSLPMMSKDGREFGASLGDGIKAPYHIKPGEHTKIYTFDKAGHCNVEMELPFQTGKVDFNFNNDEIAFSIPGLPELGPAGLTFGNNDEGNQFQNDAYVYRRSNGQLIRLSNADVQGLKSYPAFMSDGRVVVLQTALPKGRSTMAPPRDQPDELLVFDVSDPVCHGNAGQVKSSLAASATALSPEKCREAVKTALSGFDGVVADDPYTGSISVDDVKAACGK